MTASRVFPLTNNGTVTDEGCWARLSAARTTTVTISVKTAFVDRKAVARERADLLLVATFYFCCAELSPMNVNYKYGLQCVSRKHPPTFLALTRANIVQLLQFFAQTLLRERAANSVSSLLDHRYASCRAVWIGYHIKGHFVKMLLPWHTDSHRHTQRSARSTRTTKVVGK